MEETSPLSLLVAVRFLTLVQEMDGLCRQEEIIFRNSFNQPALFIQATDVSYYVPKLNHHV